MVILLAAGYFILLIPPMYFVYRLLYSDGMLAYEEIVKRNFGKLVVSFIPSGITAGALVWVIFDSTLENLAFSLICVFSNAVGLAMLVSFSVASSVRRFTK